MAERCREIQERIEETREEAREECREVSRTISETICSWLPWPLDDICDVVTRVITEIVCTTVYVLITMGVSQLSSVLVSGAAELVGNVPLTVGCWALVGLTLQILIHAMHRRVRLDPAPLPTRAPL